MQFNYQARNKKGDIHTGYINASSKESAVSILRDRGLYPTFLEEDIPPLFARKIKLFEKISKKDVVLFSRELSIMFKSNIPLVESLNSLANEIRNNDFKEKILKISEEVESGTIFSQALARYPKIFPLFYVAVVKSGEASGKLSDALDYLSDHLEREYYLNSKIKGAMVYPSLVVFVIFLVITLLIFFVLPNLISIFEEGDYQLPLATRIVIASTNWFRKWWWFGIIVLSGLIAFVFKFSSTEDGKKILDKFFLKIPIIGNFLKMVYLSRFAENLSTLISSGLSIMQSLDIVRDIIGNSCYKEAILQAKEGVRKGEMISSFLKKFPDLFSPIFIQMVLVGERTGRLDSSLSNVINFYQKEIDRSIDTILSILEPLLILFLGVVVAGIMISILMPLYQIISF